MEPLRGLSAPNGQALFSTTIVFLVLDIIAGGLRIWAKILVGRKFEMHDYVAAAALACTSGFAIICILCVYPGTIGMRTVDAVQLGPDVMVNTLKTFYSVGFLWVISTSLVKLSLLHFYRGIFIKRSIGSSRASFLRYLAYGTYGITIVFCFAHILALLLVCKPISQQWNPTPGGKCGDVDKINIGSTSTNMVLDFIIVGLPLPALWTLQLPPKKKLSIGAILSLGFGVCVINVARLSLLLKGTSDDFTKAMGLQGVMTGLEVYVGFLSACLPTLGPIFMRDKIADEARSRRFYVSKSRERPGKPSKTLLGDSLLNTTHSMEPLHDQEIQLEDTKSVQTHNVSQKASNDRNSSSGTLRPENDIHLHVAQF